MKITQSQYATLIKAACPKSRSLKDVLMAFLIGGGICLLGQGLYAYYGFLGCDKDVSSALVSVSLIGLSAILTGCNVYDKLAKKAGAGTLVPITGFANAVVSPALEFKTEGYILGVAAKMFTIAGPVIVYGAVASVVYGIVYFLIGNFIG